MPSGARKIGNEVVDPSVIDSLFSCLLYVNIHSESLDLGELRGQLVPPRTPLLPGPDFIRGDTNGDGNFCGIDDALYILRHQFQGGPPPPCEEAADADGDNVVDGIADALHVLRHQFLEGPPPPGPYPDCGGDPDPPGLGCDTHPGCP